MSCLYDICAQCNLIPLIVETARKRYRSRSTQAG
jgi:hypothetical protein